MGQPLTIINELDKTINVSWRPILLVADPNEEYTINAQDYVAHTAKATLYEVTITYLLGKQPFKHQFNGAFKATWAVNSEGIRVLLEGKELVPNQPQLLGVPISNPEVQKILRGVQSLVDQGLIGA